MATRLRSRSIQNIVGDVRAGLTTSLSGRWSEVWLPLAIYGLVAMSIVLGSAGVFPFSLPPLWKVLVIPPLLVIFPSLIEEVVFRGVLLPRDLADATPIRRFAGVSASTLVFTLWHPFNHWVIGLSDTSIFLEPPFLLVVVALGFACGYSYLRTGSLWAPIFIHWTTTVLWNLFFGR